MPDPALPQYISLAKTAAMLGVYAVPKPLSIVVLREDVEVSISDAPFWTSHRVGIEAVARVDFAFPLQSAIVAVHPTAAP